MDWHNWSEGLSMAATVAFAVTAVLAIKADKGIDLFGAVVLADPPTRSAGTARR